jgi:hypothetical protein
MSEQGTTKDKFFERAHRISRSVTANGDPLYVLYEDISIASPFGYAVKSNRLAENRDRGVLEQAIRFLEVGE